MWAARRGRDVSGNRGHAMKQPGSRTEPAIIENSGLCATCENQPTCMYAGNAEHPVLQCEEFSHGPTGAGRPPRVRLSLAKAPGPAGPDEESFPPVKGLCADCENRFTCASARLDGGVWQCAEYR